MMSDFFTQLFGGETIFFQFTRRSQTLNVGIHGIGEPIQLFLSYAVFALSIVGGLDRHFAKGDDICAADDANILAIAGGL